MSKEKIRVVAAQIEKGGRYLITQRKETSSLPLLWEFPGGRVEPDENDDEALKRELQENLQIDVSVKSPSVAVNHEYTNYVIDFRVYHCELIDPEQPIQVIGIQDYRWVKPAELDNYEFPGADQATVDELLADNTQKKR